ncbi:LacI family DNA-binding transcriptional regulator [Ruania halotolerans]|uniref:LacI family DNA-binding transcriptional regulator n=1 Tax=Ruania halotolerans TaxID=2897773 RepID=UPI001E42AF75|nr:LacI family DNA-binding transcriptional regulator [Ruania halotolerans]UFU04961.1 LacI family transcriptional regulator [Ruania halotolerans]
MSRRADGKQATTIYDVAEKAGVAPSTVSRAFSRPGRVNAETAERIRAIAAELGYRANPQARALSTTRTGMLAVVLADVTNPVFAEVVRGAGRACDHAGYTMLLAETEESAEKERAMVDRALGSVDAIVLSSSRMSDAAIRQVAKVEPLVVLNREVPGVPCVIVDFEPAMHRIAEHLAGLGHRQVTYVAGPEASWADGMRWRGLRAATDALGLRLRRVGPVAPTVAGGQTAVVDWDAHRTSAVVAYNDMVAIGVIRRMATLGVRVPDDVSVVGFDNTPVGELVTPALTTVAAPLRALGETGASNALALARGARSRATEPVRLPTRLIVRGSTAKASR